MDPRERHFGPITKIGATPAEHQFDVGSLIRRLILFEHCYMESINLSEIPSLLNTFGYEGVMQLLEDPGFEIIMSRTMMATVDVEKTNFKSHLGQDITPYGQYTLHAVSVAITAGDLPDLALKSMENTLLSGNQKKRLRASLLKKLIILPLEIPQIVTKGFQHKLLNQTYLLKDSLAKLLLRENGIDVESRLTLEIENPDPHQSTYLIQTNLNSNFGLDLSTVQATVAKCLRGMSDLDLRFYLMKELNALTGFNAIEAPFLQDQLDFLYNSIDPNLKEHQFTRVVDLGELPSLDSEVAQGSIDMSKILSLRTSQDCIDLRRWLRECEALEDAEIVEQFDSIKEKLTSILSSKFGRILRFLIVTGPGMLVSQGLVVPAALSVADSFLLDSILRKPGPVSILSKNYASIFRY